MTFRKYLDSLNTLLEEHPEAAEFEAVWGDDAGNGFHLVTHAGEIGNLGDDLEFTYEKKPNAVCIN